MKTKSGAKTGKHAHEWTRSKPTATVDTCYCGKFRHNENNTSPVIVEQPVPQHTVSASEHTPTPWMVSRNNAASIYTDSETRETIASCIETKDAAFIVRAVNNHEELLEAIMNVCKVIGVNETHLKPEQADALRALAKAHDIAKAEGK